MTDNRTETPGPKFIQGRTLATPGAVAALEESGQHVWDFLSRHTQGDWGNVGEEDWQLNDDALLDGCRLLSAYRTLKGVSIWIVTEAAGDDGRRAVTTILLPEEY
jgi:hypothetical protein